MGHSLSIRHPKPKPLIRKGDVSNVAPRSILSPKIRTLNPKERDVGDVAPYSILPHRTRTQNTQERSEQWSAPFNSNVVGDFASTHFCRFTLLSSVL